MSTLSDASGDEGIFTNIFLQHYIRELQKIWN
jgi:hypothetical protein